jgi:hypothetical protein
MKSNIVGEIIEEILEFEDPDFLWEILKKLEMNNFLGFEKCCFGE